MTIEAQSTVKQMHTVIVGPKNLALLGLKGRKQIETNAFKYMHIGEQDACFVRIRIVPVGLIEPKLKTPYS